MAAAFRPPEQICVLWSYLRQRAMLVTSASQHIPHRQKALTQMNLKLPHVVSEVTSVTGLAIIKAILSRERNTGTLAQVRARNCHHRAAESARALPGTGRAEPRLALPQAVELDEFYHRQSAECDRQSEGHRHPLAAHSAGKPLPPAPRPPKRRRHEPLFTARLPLFRVTGVDLTAIEGINAPTALVLLSAIGTDRSRWPTEKHFAAWLGLCPLHQSSGGTVLSCKVRPSANRAALALRLAARCLPHTHSALGAFFRRLTARLGMPKAAVATAHKLAPLVSRLLKHGEAYGAQGMEEYEQAYRERVVKPLIRKAKELGYQLLPTSERAAQEVPA